MMHVARYHTLSIAEKRSEALVRMREPPRTCPGGCGMQVTAADLLAHLDQRCTGPREPGPGSKYLSRAEALALGLSKRTLDHWAKSGRVRFRIGEDGCRQYLQGDLVDRIAEQRLRRRR